MEHGGRDRRQFERTMVALKADHAMVVHGPGEAPIPAETTVLNVSHGGMLAVVNRAVRQGDELRLSFRRPGTAASVALRAEVIWAQQGDRDGVSMWACGCRYLAPANAGDALINWVAQLQAGASTVAEREAYGALIGQ